MDNNEGNASKKLSLSGASGKIMQNNPKNQQQLAAALL